MGIRGGKAKLKDLDDVLISAVVNAEHLEYEAASSKWKNKAVAVAGGQTFARVVKKVDEIVNNSTTLQADDELLFSANANKTYGFLLVLFLVGTTIADIKLNFSLPTSASGRWSFPNLLRSDQTVTSGDLLSANALPFAAPANQFVIFIGHIKVLGTAGACTLQWAQNTAEVSDLKVLEGSYLVVWEETA